jgi:hypothetical protein
MNLNFNIENLYYLILIYIYLTLFYKVFQFGKRKKIAWRRKIENGLSKIRILLI